LTTLILWGWESPAACRFVPASFLTRKKRASLRPPVLPSSSLIHLSGLLHADRNAVFEKLQQLAAGVLAVIP